MRQAQAHSLPDQTDFPCISPSQPAVRQHTPSRTHQHALTATAWLRQSNASVLSQWLVTAVMLSLLAPPMTAAQGTCPVSVNYAVSLGQGGGDNSNVPIFVASLGITNNANVSSSETVSLNRNLLLHCSGVSALSVCTMACACSAHTPAVALLLLHCCCCVAAVLLQLPYAHWCVPVLHAAVTRALHQHMLATCCLQQALRAACIS